MEIVDTFQHRAFDEEPLDKQNASQVTFDGGLGESVSFGRFTTDSLSWIKRSSFNHNQYLEELRNYSTSGSVRQKKAYFEAYYKAIAKRKALENALVQDQCHTQVIDGMTHGGNHSEGDTDGQACNLKTGCVNCNEGGMNGNVHMTSVAITMEASVSLDYVKPDDGHIQLQQETIENVTTGLSQEFTDDHGCNKQNISPAITLSSLPHEAEANGSKFNDSQLSMMTNIPQMVAVHDGCTEGSFSPDGINSTGLVIETKADGQAHLKTVEYKVVSSLSKANLKSVSSDYSKPDDGHVQIEQETIENVTMCLSQEFADDHGCNEQNIPSDIPLSSLLHESEANDSKFDDTKLNMMTKIHQGLAVHDGCTEGNFSSDGISLTCLVSETKAVECEAVSSLSKANLEFDTGSCLNEAPKLVGVPENDLKAADDVDSHTNSDRNHNNVDEKKKNLCTVEPGAEQRSMFQGATSQCLKSNGPSKGKKLSGERSLVVSAQSFRIKSPLPSVSTTGPSKLISHKVLKRPDLGGKGALVGEAHQDVPKLALKPDHYCASAQILPKDLSLKPVEKKSVRASSICEKGKIHEKTSNNGRSRLNPGKSNTTAFSLRSDERAERRKKFNSTVEAKLSAKETERKQAQTRSLEEVEEEMKQFRRSLNFKATPMPTFYKESSQPMTEAKKLRAPTTRAKCPKLGRKNNGHEESSKPNVSNVVPKKHVSLHVDVNVKTRSHYNGFPSRTAQGPTPTELVAKVENSETMRHKSTPKTRTPTLMELVSKVEPSEMKRHKSTPKTRVELAGVSMESHVIMQASNKGSAETLGENRSKQSDRTSRQGGCQTNAKTTQGSVRGSSSSMHV